MNRTQGSKASYFGQYGFSMVELMVAMTLGVVLLSGVVSIFQSNKRTYITSDAVAEVQEGVRIAYDYISREARMAGSGYSCLASVDAVQNMLNDKDAFDFDFGTPVEGYGEKMAYPAEISESVLASTDALVVRGTYGVSAKLESELDSTSADLKVTSIDPPPFEDGDIVVVTDCRTASIFQITNYNGNGNSGSDNVVHNTGGSTTPGNATKIFTYPFQAGATIIKTRTIAYYIGTGASGQPALFQRATDGGSSSSMEVVEGVQDMQLEYGLDTDNDHEPEGYFTATAIDDGSAGGDWSKVISIKINLLVRSTDDDVVDTIAKYTLDGEEVKPSDKRIYRPVNFVVAVRGRLK